MQICILYYINSFISWYKNSKHSLLNLASKFWGTSSHRNRHVHTEVSFCTQFQGLMNPLHSIHGYLWMCLISQEPFTRWGLFLRGKGKQKHQVNKEEQGIGIQTTLTVEQRCQSGGVDGLKCCCMPLATLYTLSGALSLKDGEAFYILPCMYRFHQKHKPNICYLSINEAG